VRHNINLDKVGQVAELPLDPSPIQIGTEGIFNNKPFVVLGRIVYEYDQGNWNEWHLVFNDGSSGWLSDAMLNYAVSFLVRSPGDLPAPDKITRQSMFQWDTTYFVSTKTAANYKGVEGELPFEYWDKSRVLFVDLRTADGRFATLDYSEANPLLFMGRFVEFDELRLKNVKLFEGWTQ
jgi:hypothetical protein